LALSVIYLSRVGVVGRVFAAELTHVLKVFMPPAVAAQNTDVRPFQREKWGDMLEAMARIAPLQPNEAMARTSPRCPMAQVANNKMLSAQCIF
jgi:hypothetical protein